MDSIRRERREANRQSGLPLGVSNRFSRVWVNSVESVGMEARLWDEPVALNDFQPLQDNSGTNYFMVGISAVDGPDPIA